MTELVLSDYIVGDNPNMTYSDPPLIHERCGAVLCTVEQRDSLDTLTEVARAHAAECSADRAVTIDQLIRIAAEMIGAIPNDELGDDPAVSVCNGLSELVRRAAGVPEDRQSEIDDAIAWANS